MSEFLDLLWNSFLLVAAWMLCLLVIAPAIVQDGDESPWSVRCLGQWFRAVVVFSVIIAVGAWVWRWLFSAASGL